MSFILAVDLLVASFSNVAKLSKLRVLITSRAQKTYITYRFLLANYKNNKTKKQALCRTFFRVVTHDTDCKKCDVSSLDA